MCVCICVPWQPRNAIGVDRTTLLYIYNENKKKKEFCHELLLSCRARNRGVPAVYAMREGRLLGQSIGVLSNKLYFRWLMRMCRSFPVGRSWGCQCHAAAALLALLRSYVYYLYTCCLSTQRTHTDQLESVNICTYSLSFFVCKVVRQLAKRGITLPPHTRTNKRSPTLFYIASFGRSPSFNQQGGTLYKCCVVCGIDASCRISFVLCVASCRIRFG